VIAIAQVNFPGQNLVIAAVLLYVSINIVASIPYFLWLRRRQPPLEHQAGAINEITDQSRVTIE